MEKIKKLRGISSEVKQSKSQAGSSSDSKNKNGAIKERKNKAKMDENRFKFCQADCNQTQQITLESYHRSG